MSQASKTPHFLWIKALNTSNYLVNQSATRVNLRTTPFERFTCKTLDFSHSKVFGSLAYIHVDKEEKKLDAKAIKTTFIGCDSKTKCFRCYSPLLQKSLCLEMSFFMSPNLVFEQNQMSLGWI